MKNIFISILVLIGLANTTQGQTNLPTTLNYPTGFYTLIGLPQAFDSGSNTTPTLFNYDQTWLPSSPTTDTSSSTFYLGTFVNIPVVTSYTDGWGRPLQTIAHGSKTTADIVVPSDNRASMTNFSFLPYNAAGRNVGFQMSPLSDQRNFYEGTNYYPHEGGTSYSQSQTSFKNHYPVATNLAPGRILVGQNVGDSAITTFDTSLAIPEYLVDTNGNLENFTTYFPRDQLVIQTTYEPGGAKSRVYSDKGGRILCKQAYAGSNTWLTSYYVYNDVNNLMYIIPPKVVAENTISSSTWSSIQSLCYSYTYDNLGRQIIRHVPGEVGNEYTVYDARQRPVLFQSPLLLSQGKWQFNIYDIKGRVVISGLITDTTTLATWEGLLTGTITPNSSAPYYSLLTWLLNGFQGTYPSSIATNCQIQNYSYYDNYSWDPAFSSRQFATNFSSYYLTGSNMLQPAAYMFAQGELTATKVLTANGTGAVPNQWITYVYFYDQKGRLTQTQTLNPFNTVNWDTITTQYDFNGRKVLDIIKTYAWAGSNKPSTLLQNQYTYDDYFGRLKEVQQKADTFGWRTIATYNYDDLNRLTQKIMGGVEEQDYHYNIRGQLTSINSDYLEDSTIIENKTFGDSISYDYGFYIPRYDGLISGVQWRGAFSGSSLREYGFRYDTLGRLTNADFGQDSGAFWPHDAYDYSMSNVTYDAGGNILTMTHKAPIPTLGVKNIDYLSYTYGSDSKLQKVVDTVKTNYNLGDFQDGTNTGNDYTYDNDGNLASDSNKHIRLIAYNELDLPTAVTVNGPSAGNITNYYDANGDLLQKIIKQGTYFDTLRYWGALTYQNDSLQYILHPQGRARWLADSSMFKYDYFVTDHLGNVRTVVTSDYSSSPTNYFATHELASAGLESSIFANIANVSEDKPYGGPGDTKAARLTNTNPNQTIGTAILLQVMAGDKFDVSADSYWDTASSNYSSPSSMLSAILGTLTGQAGGFNNGENNTSLVNGLFNSTNYVNIYDPIKDSLTDPTLPRAYINYIVFDNQMNVVASQSGAIQVGATPGSWQPIATDGPIQVQQNGYVAIYMSNETAPLVYMDNMSVNHYSGRLLQEQHYYPFGLAIKEGEATGPDNLTNKFKFETNQVHDELGVNQADFNARQYDYQIGRFTSIDPLSDGLGQEFLSPYHFGFNNPVNNVDPTGMGTHDESGNGPQAQNQAVQLPEYTITASRLTQPQGDGGFAYLMYISTMQNGVNNGPGQWNGYGASGGGGGGTGSYSYSYNENGLVVSNMPKDNIQWIPVRMPEFIIPIPTMSDQLMQTGVQPEQMNPVNVPNVPIAASVTSFPFAAVALDNSYSMFTGIEITGVATGTAVVGTIAGVFLPENVGESYPYPHNEVDYWRTPSFRMTYGIPDPSNPKNKPDPEKMDPDKIPPGFSWLAFGIGSFYLYQDLKDFHDHPDRATNPVYVEPIKRDSKEFKLYKGKAYFKQNYKR